MVRSCIGSTGAAFKDFFLLSFFDPDPEGDPAIWKKQDEENRARRGGGDCPGGELHDYDPEEPPLPLSVHHH